MAYYIKDELIGLGCPRFWPFSNLYILQDNTHISIHAICCFLC